MITMHYPPESNSEYVAKSEKINCPECGKEVTEKGLSLHMSFAHSGYSVDRPIKCRVDLCNKHYQTQKQVNDHFKAEHAPKVKCPERNREYGKYSLPVHRRNQHGVDV